MNRSVSPGRYRHFKGGEYEVIDVARHSETEQWLVVYRPLYGEGRLWVRPLDLFTDQKTIDGKTRPRFERIGESAGPELCPQARVETFCREHQLSSSPPARLLDVCSELGELAKVWLKNSRYGAVPEAGLDSSTGRAEFGDTLFALLCLANESGIDAESALTDTLERYRQRIHDHGHPGSG
ncbi:MAG: DUF1653 domain-containing protein [Wenzhouxiangella sp.]|nr:MAG: DUF1653 domain-containing protein [Wenzhouxiangella sp.]